MANRSNSLVPMALFGAGLLLMAGSGQRRTGMTSTATVPVRRHRFNMLMGPPGRLYPVPVDIDLDQLVLLFGEYRDGYPQPATRVRLHHAGGVSENIWVVERVPQIFDTLSAAPSDFLCIHQPVGTTAPRVGPEWADKPSMELAPVYVNRAYIEMIGPASALHLGRRRMGKIYTTDGLELELYESLDRLRQMVGPGVRETRYTTRYT